MYFRYLILFLMLALAFSEGASAQPDNFKFISNLSDSSAQKFFYNHNVRGKGFAVSAQESHPANFIMEQSIVNYLKNNNGKAFVQIETGTERESGPDYNIEFKIIGLTLKYEKASKKDHPKGKNIWRKGNCVSIFRILSHKDGEVIKTEEVTVESHDFISAKQAREFSAKRNFYLAPELSRGGYKKFVEPILVGSAVTTLIVLFFSNR